MTHWQTVTGLLKDTLQRLMAEPLFQPFRLVGGTAFSLQKGHRISVDIDLFTDAAYDASIKEIAAMKMDVVQRSGRKKDFWDLHEMLGTYSLSEMIAFHESRYPYAHDEQMIWNNLTNFTDADNDFDPECLTGKQWEIVKLDIVESVQGHSRP